LSESFTMWALGVESHCFFMPSMLTTRPPVAPNDDCSCHSAYCPFILLYRQCYRSLV